jgi:transcription antitermination factor NusG
MDCGPINSSGFTTDNPRPWYALYTRHQHEKTVAEILAYKGFETLLPLYKVMRRWRDRTKLLSLPLFPCYVFLNGGLERRLDIMTTPGIHALVSNAGQPAAIPAAEIDSIRRAVESGSRIEPHPMLRCGDWVRVKCGPLEGIQGILVRKKNLCRLVLSVEMLGKAAAVEVDGLLVERVNGKPPGLCGMDYAAASTHAGPRVAL